MDLSASRQIPRRARELGVIVGTLPTGPLNAITDVPGVRVAHTTIIEGDSIRTGVTAIVPDQLQRRRSLPAGLFVGNGYGKFVGSTQLVELGEIETPIVLTATLSTFRAADAVVTFMLDRVGHEEVRSVNPVVGETNDGFLSDIRARPVTEAHVLSAIEGASAGLPAEGAVGAGTGTAALGFKAGIGTSSRQVATSRGSTTVGVLVQANFSGVLQVLGVPIPPDRVGVPGDAALPQHAGNSCVIVVAVDGGFDSRQLTRIARRAVFAMGRVGSDFAGGSGDYAIAFSTSGADTAAAPESDVEPIFGAVLDAVEEALLNSLFMAETTRGHQGHIKYAVPHDRMLELLRTVTQLDHVVIAVSDWQVSAAFYRDVVGAEVIDVGNGRFAFRVGPTQLNVHGPGVDPADNIARLPVRPGNSDLCFVWDGPIEEAVVHLRERGVEVETGPVRRFGARGAGTSVYFRDPDGSLLEFISYA